jgi:hypothetical protein
LENRSVWKIDRILIETRKPRLIVAGVMYEWLDDATKTIGEYWARRNARRNSMTTENQANLGEILVN